MRTKFIVIEGIDRSGKSTLCKNLKDILPTTTYYVCYPNRNNKTGNLIDLYLKEKVQMKPEVIHLLFSANRWEDNERIKSMLNGTFIAEDEFASTKIQQKIKFKNLETKNEIYLENKHRFTDKLHLIEDVSYNEECIGTKRIELTDHISYEQQAMNETDMSHSKIENESTKKSTTAEMYESVDISMETSNNIKTSNNKSDHESNEDISVSKEIILNQDTVVTSKRKKMDIKKKGKVTKEKKSTVKKGIKKIQVEESLANFKEEETHENLKLKNSESKETYNRIEVNKDDIVILCDRYYFSGCAYTTAKGLEQEWAASSDKGLVEPDLVLFLDLQAEEAARRDDFGKEKYETIDFQNKVYENMKKLVSNHKNGKVVDANVSEKELCESVMKMIIKTF